MKALHWVPDWFGPRNDHQLKDKKGNPIDFTPFSQMANIQVHFRGYDWRGNRYDFHIGNGSKTLFYRFPRFVSGAEEVEREARLSYMHFKNEYDNNERELRQHMNNQENQNNKHRNNKKRNNKKNQEQAVA